MNIIIIFAIADGYINKDAEVMVKTYSKRLFRLAWLDARSPQVSLVHFSRTLHPGCFPNERDAVRGVEDQ